MGSGHSFLSRAMWLKELLANKLALIEKCCGALCSRSVINTRLWLSRLLTGFQMPAAGVIRALGSTVLEIITG